ncbi:unnamed protein product, partial [Hymenolepis diminuta]|uniref:Secreted protein n=1 Tax=Hymenolepis diminuta TaxID=6216 RepID=A0A0R3SP45_HYMDI
MKCRAICWAICSVVASKTISGKNQEPPKEDEKVEGVNPPAGGDGSGGDGS